jgi:DNA-directed RNA polymerase specialized sigma24 family protein
MSLRDTLEAWCAGDHAGGHALREEVTALGRHVFSRYRHQSISEQDADDHAQTVLMRLWNQRSEKLNEAALATDDDHRLRMLRQAAVRGADADAMAAALGRPLRDDEVATTRGRIPTDGAARAYLRQAFRNRFNRLLQQNKRRVQLDADRPIAAAPQEAPRFSGEALDLLDRLLGTFEAWGNDRSPGGAGPGTRNMESLEELAWAGRDSLSARDITALLDPDLGADALQRAGAARGRAWRRARERFHVFAGETRLSRQDRPLIPEVRRAFDDRYRLRRRAGVRKAPPARPPTPRSDP